MKMDHPTTIKMNVIAKGINCGQWVVFFIINEKPEIIDGLLVPKGDVIYKIFDVESEARTWCPPGFEGVDPLILCKLPDGTLGC